MSNISTDRPRLLDVSPYRCEGSVNGGDMSAAEGIWDDRGI